MKHLYTKFVKFSAAKTLNEDQLKFVKIFFSGKNIFLTGNGGAGKSFVIKVLFEFLHEEEISVGRAALTGTAALNIGGSTLHSWTGIGLGANNQNQLLNEVLRNKKARDRIARTKILFVDEISMANGSLLNKLNFIFKYIRNNDKPFGGIQCIWSGDQCQLNPVFKAMEEDCLSFESEAWKEANPEVVVLKKIMRQDDNSEFVEALNLIRMGDLSKIHIINSRIDAKFPDDGIKPVKLLCKNVDVDKFNNEKLAFIKGKEEKFYAVDTGEPYLSKYFDKNCLAPKVLTLKVGAQCMLLRNLDVENGYVNGSIGIVEGFTDEGPRVKFICGTMIVSKESWSVKEQKTLENGKIEFKELGSRTQIPLKLAYCITIHKSAGLTLERAEVDLNEVFTAGQAYVALSRIRNLESLSVKKFPHSKIFADQRCVDFYKNLKDPVVEDFKEDENLNVKIKENFEFVDL